MLISAFVSSFLNLGGGITSSGSSEMIRCHASLSSKLLRTKAAIPSFSRNASSSKSKRRLALRDFSEGPWQKKHLFEMIGLMSRLKETFENTFAAEREKMRDRENNLMNEREFVRLLFITTCKYGIY